MFKSTLKSTGLGLLAVAITASMTAMADDHDLPDARALIDRHIETVGGRAALEAQADAIMTGSFSMPAVGITGDLLVASRAPAERVVQIELPGMGTIKTGYSPDLAWSIDPFMGPRLIEGEEFEALTESSVPAAVLRDPEFVKSATTVELTEFMDQACYRVKLEWRSGRQTFDCYAVESGLLIATESTESSPMGEMQTVTLLGEHKEMHGFLVPTVTRVQTMGQEQVLTMTEFKLESPDPALFELPPAIQTLVEDR
ncbi:MAG: hypothetical protein JJU31_01425 [Wenzhouxiangella sp.]|nr:hypothetical protein [Wenzhouxiangella sp.]TVR94759.1 MAG: hypothetical protein EA418_09420 [Wenzhouxiangellaceae bacterium]